MLKKSREETWEGVFGVELRSKAPSVDGLLRRRTLGWCGAMTAWISQTSRRRRLVEQP
jgi:hypothetical protein